MESRSQVQHERILHKHSTSTVHDRFSCKRIAFVALAVATGSIDSTKLAATAHPQASCSENFKLNHLRPELWPELPVLLTNCEGLDVAESLSRLQDSQGVRQWQTYIG